MANRIELWPMLEQVASAISTAKASISIGNTLLSLKQYVCTRPEDPKTVIRKFHETGIHAVRDLGFWVRNQTDADVREGTHPEITNQFCSASSEMMAFALGCRNDKPHCCLKMYIQTPQGPKIATIGRSAISNDEQRPLEFGTANAHPAKENTVFAALLGMYDGKRQWDERSSFVSNNLKKYEDQFMCTRRNWWLFYRSTLVYPLRYRPSGHNDYSYCGFLTFDRKHPNGFRGMPEIFKYTEKKAPYEKACRESIAWHLGASVADMLAVAMGNFLSNTQSKEVVFK